MLSVLNQNYANLEYVLVDGGSSDDSVEIIKRHAGRLAHWETGPDDGMYAAVAKGLNRSTGEVMGWLNSDDMHLPWTLRAVGEIFEIFPEVQWITTTQPAFWDYRGIMIGLGQIDGFSRDAFLDGRNFSPLTERPRTIGHSVNLQGCLQQESTFWRRSLWDKAGGYLSQDYGSAGDFELWCRFLRHAEPYGVTIPLAGFRLQNQQQTAQRQLYGNECLNALLETRRYFGWKRNRMRSFAFRFGVRRPARMFARHEYTGKSIVRVNVNAPEAGWRIETCRFR